MADAVLKTVRAMTGHDVTGCPWHAFKSPLVREVINAYGFFESGNLAVALPNPSHRLIEGLSFWHRVYSRVTAKFLELERKPSESVGR